MVALRGSVASRLVVAALGPKMCRLAGEVADGVLFNWLTPEYAKKSAEASAVDRSLSDRLNRERGIEFSLE